MVSLIRESATGDLTTTSLVVSEQFGRPHNEVMKSLRTIIDDGLISLGDFTQSTYVNSRNQNQPMFELTERGFLIAMPFIGGKKSKEGQVRLVDAFLEAQKRLRQEVPEAIPQKLTAKTIIAESAARMLRMSETSKLRMLGKIAEEEGVSAGFLPDYASNESLTKALGDLLKEHDSSLSARAANVVLLEMNLLEELERRSSKGGTKKFKSITDEGLKFGRNETSPQSPNQTQPRYYVDKFPELLAQIEGWLSHDPAA